LDDENTSQILPLQGKEKLVATSKSYEFCCWLSKCAPSANNFTTFWCGHEILLLCNGGIWGVFWSSNIQTRINCFYFMCFWMSFQWKYSQVLIPSEYFLKKNCRLEGLARRMMLWWSVWVCELSYGMKVVPKSSSGLSHTQYFKGWKWKRWKKWQMLFAGNCTTQPCNQDRIAGVLSPSSCYHVHVIWTVGVVTLILAFGICFGLGQK